METPADVSELTSRVTRLEESLNALAETAKDGGSVPDAAALDAKIGDIEQKLQGKIDSALAAQQASNATGLEALQNEVAALKAKLGALAEANLAGDSSDLAPQLTTLDQRIASSKRPSPHSPPPWTSPRQAPSQARRPSLCQSARCRRRWASLRRRACRDALSDARSGRSRRASLPCRHRHPDVAELARNLAKTAETSAAPRRSKRQPRRPSSTA